MQNILPNTTLSYDIPNLTEGNRYALMVTGATGLVSLEFQHQENGAWFAQPGYTPASGTVLIDFIAVVSRMRVKVASGQTTPWVATWVKQTYPDN